MSRVKISGFSIIRNAVLMDYPVVESIRSLLPLVDEMVVGVGQSDDGTKALIESIGDPKLKVFDSFWDPARQKGGLILSEKTNEALARCENDWCLYLQADEVLHEKDYGTIRKSFDKANQSPQVEGLLFDYVHFYGSHRVVAQSRRWYRREVRAIRKSTGAQSVGDAQSFRVPDGGKGRKLQVIHSGAKVFHYGWVKPPESMRTKKKLLDRLWHGDKLDNENEKFDFRRLYGLKLFRGQHPAMMENRVASQTWDFDHRRRWSDWELKDLNLWASDLVERATGYRIGEYKPYRWIKGS